MTLDPHTLRMNIPDLSERDVFICGPEPFTTTVARAARRAGVHPRGCTSRASAPEGPRRTSRAGGPHRSVDRQAKLGFQARTSTDRELA